MFLYCIEKLVSWNKLTRKLRIWLKDYPFRKILARAYAEKTSMKMLIIFSEITRERYRDTTDRARHLELRLRYKEEALRHFNFVGQTTEFTKGVVYTVLAAILITMILKFYTEHTTHSRHDQDLPVPAPTLVIPA